MNLRVSLTASILAVGATSGATMAFPTSASADVEQNGGGPCMTCGINGEDMYAGLTEKQTKDLPTSRRETVVEDGKKVTKLVRLQYGTALACPGDKEPDQAIPCPGVHEICAEVTDGDGPLSRIFYRPITSKKDREPWHTLKDPTCWPTLVPGDKGKPRLTVAMIRSAFVKTPFVKPKATMEPVGNKTLVNLPNYFTADFSGAGYGPGEVRTVTLLGHKVQLKPVLKSNTFHFGDGSSLGPTVSRGGGYPNGDVKHTYKQRGTVSASVTTVYGGQFAVDGGKFTDLPGSATITGPAQPIQVLEATGRLVR